MRICELAKLRDTGDSFDLSLIGWAAKPLVARGGPGCSAILEELRAEGRTIIVVEHVMDAIRSLCDRCVVMNSGTKIAEGPTSEVLAEAAVLQAYLGDDRA